MFWPASMVPIGSMVTEIITGIGCAEFAAQFVDRQSAGLDVARVLAGFEQQQVGAAFDQAFGLRRRNSCEAGRR